MFFHFIPKSTANSVYAGRFLGFSVYVSNSTNKEEGFLCYHDTNHTVTDIPPELTVPCDVQGRYVIYYNSRKSGLSPRFGYSGKAFINLCEVEVYGKTSDTSYFLHLKTSVKIGISELIKEVFALLRTNRNLTFRKGCLPYPG